MNEKEPKKSDRSRTAIQHVCAALGALALSSCASSTRTDPPPPGMAVIDATPDPSRRDRIDGIRIVSVNGIPTHRTEAELPPGENRVRVRFKWPQGGTQEVDLDFQARPDTIYAIDYGVYPHFFQKRGVWMSVRDDVDSGGGDVAALALLAGPVLVPFSIAEKTAHLVEANSRAAEYVDLVVVAQRSSQGIACERRVYADGRIKKR